MQAGRMRDMLDLLSPVKSVNRFGEQEEKFELRGRAHAERVRMTGRMSVEVGEHFPDYSVRWNIRDAHVVKENWRVREVGGYEYTVTNIIPNRNRGMLTLVCERVNL